MIIYTLQANNGDCFIADFQNGKCVLIDGGTPGTYNDQIKYILLQLRSERKSIEYLICTHFDDDHIGGLINLIQNNGKYSQPKIIPIENVILNQFDFLYSNNSCIYSDSLNQISYQQQQSFEDKCNYLGYPIQKTPVVEGRVFSGRGYNIKVVAPSTDALIRCKNSIDKRKTSEKISAKAYTDISQWADLETGSELNEINCASLAFEIRFNKKTILFCGDSDMNTYKEALQKKYDLIKLSHHGTYHGNECFVGKKPATSAEKYLISTNSKKYYHPELRLLAGIILQDRYKEFYFNYDLPSLQGRDYYLLNDKNQQQKYQFKINTVSQIEI